MATEPVVFTSWKEIASYLGKGVRTVQRWEAQLGLPVRRPDTRPKGLVRASRDDLNHWVATRWSSLQREKPAVSDELAELRKTVAQLTSENASLKRELEESKRGNRPRANSRFAELGELSYLLQQCERLLRQNELLCQQFAETMEMTKNLRETSHSGTTENKSHSRPVIRSSTAVRLTMREQIRELATIRGVSELNGKKSI